MAGTISLPTPARVCLHRVMTKEGRQVSLNFCHEWGQHNHEGTVALIDPSYGEPGKLRKNKKKKKKKKKNKNTLLFGLKEIMSKYVTITLPG